MTTQKQTLEALTSAAVSVGYTISIRKNAHGEYEARLKRLGERFASVYFANSFKDAAETLRITLEHLGHEARRMYEILKQEQRRRKARDVADAIFNLKALFKTFDCTIHVDGDGVVTMSSPKTGPHTLNMNCRPVTDLYAHGMGFAEQQTHGRNPDYAMHTQA